MMMRGFWAVLIPALVVYGCSDSNGGPIGDGGTGGTGGVSGMGGMGGTGGVSGMGGTGGVSGMGGAGGASGMGGTGGASGMGGTGGVGGMGGTSGMGGTGGVGGAGGAAGVGGAGGMAGAGGTGGMGGVGGTGGAGGMGGVAGAGGTGGMPPMASSCSELKASGENVSGNYVINVAGVGTLTVYCDMTTDGGGWTQLYDQDAGAGVYEPTTTWATGVNIGEPNMGDYSILHLIDAFEGLTPGFEFLLAWPGEGFVQWEQSENPFVGRGIVTNVIESPTGQVGCASAPNFGGLAADNDGSTTAESALDGSTDSCWWWAVGTSAPFFGGIPAYSAAAQTGRLVVARAQLWVR